MDQTPTRYDVTLSKTSAIQIEATIGAMPSINAGTMTSDIQASASLAMLTSANSVPASASSERPLGLDASSSMSPRRGSIVWIKPYLLDWP
jgi:hypothetical protein